MIGISHSAVTPAMELRARITSGRLRKLFGDVAQWWFKWCRHDVISEGRFLNGTNNDRLGRILMEVTGVKPKPSPGDIVELDIELSN